MHLGHNLISGIVSRRTFLAASGIGLASLHGPGLLRGRGATSKPQAKARSTIMIWLCGGASHIDTWDMKPEAPAEFRGEFMPAATSAPGVLLCEHLPRLAKQAHHLAVVQSLGHHNRGTGDHHAGYYYNLTGHAPDPTFPQLLNNRKPMASDWPFIGSVAAYKLPAHPSVPSLVSLPQKPGHPEYTRPGQFAARLGPAFDPMYVMGDLDRPMNFTVPALTLQGDVDSHRLQNRRFLLRAVDSAVQSAEQTNNYDLFQDKAFSLLNSPQSKAAFDLSKEPPAMLDQYGQTVNGMSMLLARRLVEAGVPFVTVFWKENPKLAKLCRSAGGWDTHGNNFNCLRDHLLPEFDQCYSALLADLDLRGLLNETLVLVTSEMGRKPKVGDPRSGGVKGAGRDHWTNCMSVLFAGGGIRGGQTYGTSDKIAAYPADKPVAPEDVTKTVYHAMGIDDLQAIDREGRPFALMEEGDVISDLF